MATVEKLIVELDAKVDGYVKEMKGAEKVTDKATKNMRQDTDKVSEGFGKMSSSVKVGAAAIAAAGAAAVVMTRALAQNAMEIKNNAAMARTSVEEFQELAFAYSSVGIEADKFADISKDVTDRIGDFLQTGGGPLADFFENVAPQIGLTAKELKGLSGNDALLAVKKAMDDVNLSAEEQTFHLEAIAGDASKLIPLLANGGAEMKRIAAEYRLFNTALSETEIEQLTEIDRKFSAIGESITTKASKAVAFFADDIVDLSDDMLVALAEVEGFFASGEFSARVEALGTLWTSAFDLGPALELFKEGTGSVKGETQQTIDFLMDAFLMLPNNIAAIIKISVEEIGNMLREIEERALEARITWNEAWGDDEEASLLKAELGRLQEFDALMDESSAAVIDDILAKRDADAEAFEESMEQADELGEKHAEIKEAAHETELENIEAINEAKEKGSKNKDADPIKQGEKEASSAKKTSGLIRKAEDEKVRAKQDSVNTVAVLNSALFEDNKAVGAGIVVADTAIAIGKANALGYPAAIPAIAFAAATGLAQLAAIKGASKGGGSISGGSGSIGAAPTGGLGGDDDDTSTLAVSTSGTESVGGAVISFASDSGDDFMDALAGKFNEDIASGKIQISQGGEAT